MKKLLLSALLLGALNSTLAQISSNPGTHNWSSTAAWSGGVVPTSTDEVSIISNSTITLDIPVNHDTSIIIQNGGQLQSMMVSNDLTITGGDLSLMGFSAILNFVASSAVPVTINEGHLSNGGVFMSGDLTIDNSSGSGMSDNNGDFMCSGDMVLTGTEVFENNLSMNVSGTFIVDLDCEYYNNQSATINTVENDGLFENAGTTTVSDTLFNYADLFSDGSYMDIGASIINDGDIDLLDSMHVDEDLMNTGIFYNEGVIHIANDFYNEGVITGDSTGFYLIGQNSENAAAGVINGNIDICDTTLTGTYLDIMTGSADYNTVTFCSVSYASIDQSDKETFGIFPNPAENAIQFKGVSNGYYSIYTPDGRLISQNSVTSVVDVQGLNAGLYFIIVRSEGQEYKTSFIKR